MAPKKAMARGKKAAKQDVESLEIVELSPKKTKENDEKSPKIRGKRAPKRKLTEVEKEETMDDNLKGNINVEKQNLLSKPVALNEMENIAPVKKNAKKNLAKKTSEENEKGSKQKIIPIIPSTENVATKNNAPPEECSSNDSSDEDALQEPDSSEVNPEKSPKGRAASTSQKKDAIPVCTGFHVCKKCGKKVSAKSPGKKPAKVMEWCPAPPKMKCAGCGKELAQSSYKGHLLTCKALANLGE